MFSLKKVKSKPRQRHLLKQSILMYIHLKGTKWKTEKTESKIIIFVFRQTAFLPWRD